MTIGAGCPATSGWSRPATIATGSAVENVRLYLRISVCDAMNQLESLLGQIGVVDETRPCRFTSDRYDVTFTVSTESHDVAYAIPISEAELDALEELVRVERETPYAEGGNESLSEALESVLDEGSIDAEAWIERMSEPRRAVEPIVETWRDLVDGDAGTGDDEAADATESDDGDGGTTDPEAEGDAADAEAEDEGPVDGQMKDGAVDVQEEDAQVDDERGREAFDAHVVYLPVGMESAIGSFFQLCRRREERESDPFSIPENVAPAARLLSRIDAATDRPENRVVVNTRHLPLSRGSPS